MVLQSVGSQRIGHKLVTEQQQQQQMLENARDAERHQLVVTSGVRGERCWGKCLLYLPVQPCMYLAAW